MATFPQFSFPLSDDTLGFDVETTGKKERPHIVLQTDAEIREAYPPIDLSNTYLRPPPARTLSTPPDSPTSVQMPAMDLQNLRTLHEANTITPPATPTKASHSKSSSASSDFLNTLSSLRRGDSVSSSPGGRPRKDSADPIHQTHKSGGIELITFPYHLSDYEIQKDEKGRQRRIGSGAWSDVYLANPIFSKLGDQIKTSTSLPITPVDSQASSQEEPQQLPMVPPHYAIKAPVNRSARNVLREEARVLSHLSQSPNAERHIVSFYGQDTRTDALVLRAMSGTLEAWVQQDLNTLSEPHRVQKLATVFPTMASSLLDSLSWIHAQSCIHGDIKPTNILLSPAGPAGPGSGLVFSDFSSAILSASSFAEHDAKEQGAGTWEYLDPTLHSTFSSAVPSAATDLWSLAITLLFVVIGASPYDALKRNRYQHREMMRQGAAMECLAYGDEGMRNVTRVKGLSKAVGFDVLKWFGKVLKKDVGRRVDLGEWKREVEGAGAGAKM